LLWRQDKKLKQGVWLRKLVKGVQFKKKSNKGVSFLVVKKEG
jgi:hypothetical protein